MQIVDQPLEFQRDPSFLKITPESRPIDCVARFPEVDEACLRRDVELLAIGVVAYML